jgi:uncharacterized membrane protein
MRWIARVSQFIAHVLPGVIRPLRVLWNQVVGFLFLVLAAWAVPRTVHTVREFDGNPEGVFRLLLSVVFVTLMTAFGLYSFWRARKAHRSR